MVVLFFFWGGGGDENTDNKNDYGGTLPSGVYDSDIRKNYCCGYSLIIVFLLTHLNRSMILLRLQFHAVIEERN